MVKMVNETPYLITFHHPKTANNKVDALAETPLNSQDAKDIYKIKEVFLIKNYVLYEVKHLLIACLVNLVILSIQGARLFVD